jgi:hypothetical protein
LACADRFANAWLLIPSHLFIWETIEKLKCSAFGTYAIFYTTYTLIIIFTPLCLMSLFGFLTLRNMKRLRARVLPLNGTFTVASEQRKRCDIDLIKMVLTEVMVYLILTSAYPLVFLYPSRQKFGKTRVHTTIGNRDFIHSR